jgi:hypothetical protein
VAAFPEEDNLEEEHLADTLLEGSLGEEVAEPVRR